MAGTNQPFDAGGGAGRTRLGGWLLAAGAAAAIAVIFAVIHSGDGSGLNAIAKAAEVTQREAGGRAVIDAKIASTSKDEAIEETGSVIFDDSGMSRGVMTVDAHGSGKEAEEKVLVVAQGTKTYTTSEQFDSLPEGKKWIEVDVKTSGGTESTSSSSPKEGLKLLETVEGAEEVGKEDVRGVPTTHYRGTLTAPKEVFGAEVTASALHVDVWIDAQDRIRRMQIEYTSSVSAAEGAYATKMSIDYFEFGRVPKIDLPNPAEVYDATSEVESAVQSAAE